MGKKKGRKEPICLELIKWYRDALCVNDEMIFLTRCQAYQSHTHATGPDPRTIREALRSGRAMGRTRDTILGALQMAWQEGADRKQISPEEVPKPLSLTEWPVALSNAARTLATQQARARGKTRDEQVGVVREIGGASARSRGYSVLTAADCAAEMSQIIRNSQQCCTLYAALGTGKMVANVFNRLVVDVGNIDKVVLRCLSDDYLIQLQALGLIDPALPTDLEGNVNTIQYGLTERGGIPVVVEPWKQMAPMHGMMYAGEEILYWGPWQFSYGILSTIDSPMFRLTAEDGELFRVCRAILRRGDSVGEEGMKIFWDQGKREWG